jgi:hypothetical protein
MKFKTILAVLAISVFASCKSTYRATDTTVTVVTPEMIESSFAVQYPNATNVVWVNYDPVVISPMDWQLVGYTTLDANARLVHFNQDNQNYYVLYDQTGYRVASAYVLTDFTVLPASVNDVLHIRYPGYTITGLSRVTLNSRNDQMAYAVELKKWYYTGRILIDDNGNVIDQRNVVADHV